MGYRRLLGAFVTLGGAEKGVSTLAQTLTGTTVDQIEAYKRSLSAPWDSRAAILPINTWKGGVGKAINFSYFSPYDVVKQPFTAALKTLEEGKLKQQDAGDVAFNLMLGRNGPVAKLLEPFISEAIFFEKVSDVLPSGLFIGGRGGQTKTGSKVYSITDDGPEAFMKSLVHIIEGVQPTAITTGQKLIKGFKEDITRGGKPVSLRDELLALFSGVRIINVDVPKSMQYKITDYNKKFKSVTTAEDLFSLENYQNRGPLVLADEFRQIQDETLKVNKNFHSVIQDALAVGVPKKEILKILRGRRITYAKAKRLIDGKNIPYTAYEPRMKKRVEEAKREAIRRGDNEQVNKEYFYPKKLFRSILNEYKNKSIKVGPPEESELEKLRKRIKEKETENLGNQSSIPNQETTKQVANLQTPPLPTMPMPVVQTAALPGTNTNLTRTQQALLSPEEQIIASRRTT
jgi:rubrerythrin